MSKYAQKCFFFQQKCVGEEPSNIPCAYMQAVSSVAVGKFYEGVKIATKVIVLNILGRSALILRLSKVK